ncbi:hypothetical protein VHEMI04299 [[Torrubiella] hemipterigena]|uniref:WW domain-containing protein n=1 Tax=[Torrubiella] hemipterigena TaxID=1531966 RepID=A0A0A1TDV5_9HYPO|nr:hypothetical protein VHEMI04299 [[Torrubiella] hemipterigena]
MPLADQLSQKFQSFGLNKMTSNQPPQYYQGSYNQQPPNQYQQQPPSQAPAPYYQPAPVQQYPQYNSSPSNTQYAPPAGPPPAGPPPGSQPTLATPTVPEAPYQSAYVPGKPMLPPGWATLHDAEQGRWYYVEQTTNRTQWEVPTLQSPAPPPPPPGPPAQMPPVPDTRPPEGARDGGYSAYAPAPPPPTGYAGEQNMPSEKKSSGVGGMALGAAGGLAAGAVGGMLLHKAMHRHDHDGYYQSDGDGDD